MHDRRTSGTLVRLCGSSRTGEEDCRNFPAVVRLGVQLAPYIGTETVVDFPVAWLVTAMTTHDGLRTRIMPGNWVSRPSQASIV
jgi:hypothetical protein